MKAIANNGALSPRMKVFLEEQRIFCKESTIGAYRTALASFDKFCKSRLRAPSLSRRILAKLSHEILIGWLKSLHEAKLKPGSKINYFLPVRKYLAWEVERKTVLPKTIERFTRNLLPKPPDALPKPLLSQNDALLIQRLRDSAHPYARLYLLLRFTGLRISELINLPRDCMHITANNEAFLKVPLGKMNNERLVPLHDEAASIIRNLLNSNGVADDDENINSARLIGLHGTIHHIYSKLDRPFRKMTADIKDQAKPVTFHRLRHTYATSLLAAGVSIVSIMKLLGHRRIEMSMRYASITPSLIRDEYLKAMQKLEQRWLSLDAISAAGIPNNMSPISLIDLLRAAIKTDASIPHKSRYNFLKRLTSLKSDLGQSNLPLKSPPQFLPTQSSHDFWAG